MPRSSKYTLIGGGELPKLLTAKQFASHIGKSPRWVRQACEEGRLLACQMVGHTWVIAENTLISPRYLKGFPGELLDVGLPKERLIGKTIVVPPPEYKKQKGNKLGNPKKKIALPGYIRIKEELGMGRDRIYIKTGVHPETQKKLENGETVTAKTALKLAYALDKEVEDFLRL
jgi:hypothetical protein